MKRILSRLLSRTAGRFSDIFRRIFRLSCMNPMNFILSWSRSSAEKSTAYSPRPNMSRTSLYLWLQPISRTGVHFSRAPIIAWNLEATSTSLCASSSRISSGAISRGSHMTLVLSRTAL